MTAGCVIGARASSSKAQGGSSAEAVRVQKIGQELAVKEHDLVETTAMRNHPLQRNSWGSGFSSPYWSRDAEIGVHLNLAEDPQTLLGGILGSQKGVIRGEQGDLIRS